jgi:hypothetical protein
LRAQASAASPAAASAAGRAFTRLPALAGGA